MSDATHRRYPGTRPFQDTEIDRKLFRGREGDLDRFLHLVLAERLVVLFSKSGMGKTSLLNAGLSPALRAKGYVPIHLRLNDPHKGVMESVDAQVRHSAAEKNREFVTGNTSSLWHYFKTAEFWGENDTLLTPVLIFDQFEELFTLEYSQQQQEEFFRELADLVHGQQPEVGAMASSARSRRQGESPPNVKIILSLREDYLARLEEINADIPSIFRNRYRLRSPGPDAVRRAITEPATIEDPGLASPRFDFAQGTVDLILGFLQKSDVDPQHRAPTRAGTLPWVLVGLGILAFSQFFDPVIGGLGGKTFFMRQPGVLSATIAFASLVLAYFFPMRPLYVVLTALGFHVINAASYWNAAQFSPDVLEAGIIVTGLLGSAAAGWIAWLRYRQFSSVQRETRKQHAADIEPFQVQLLCQHIEEIVLRRHRKGDARTPTAITGGDLGGEQGMQSVLRSFYQDQMKRLSPAKWWSAHKLCERGLISTSGRRLSLDGEFIADKYRASRALLDDLIDMHLIRAESRLGGHYYELSHDSLVKPIQETALQRLRRTRMFLLLGICAVLLMFVGKDIGEKKATATKTVEALDSLSSLMNDMPDSRNRLMVLHSILQQQADVLGLDTLRSEIRKSSGGKEDTSGSHAIVIEKPDSLEEVQDTTASGHRVTELTQGSILGRVYDTDDDPVEDVTIALKSTDRTVQSNSKGMFSIDDLRYGSYELMVQSAWYQVRPLHVALDTARVYQRIIVTYQDPGEPEDDRVILPAGVTASGSVRVKAYVDEQGKVVRVEFLGETHGSATNEVVKATVKKAVLKMKFAKKGIWKRAY
jgi:hypothetical protein